MTELDRVKEQLRKSRELVDASYKLMKKESKHNTVAKIQEFTMEREIGEVIKKIEEAKVDET